MTPRRRVALALAASAGLHLLAVVALGRRPAPPPERWQLVSSRGSILGVEVVGSSEGARGPLHSVAVAHAGSRSRGAGRGAPELAARARAASLDGDGRAAAPGEATAAPQSSPGEARAASVGPPVTGGTRGVGGAGVGRAEPAGMGDPKGGARGVGGPDEALAALEHRLAASARRCYPERAARFRLRGRVPVGFCLDARGQVSALKLEGTTGSELLDGAARDCVVPGAQPLPPLVGCYTVPVEFRP